MRGADDVVKLTDTECLFSSARCGCLMLLSAPFSSAVWTLERKEQLLYSRVLHQTWHCEFTLASVEGRV